MALLGGDDAHEVAEGNDDVVDDTPKAEGLDIGSQDQPAGAGPLVKLDEADHEDAPKRREKKGRRKRPKAKRSRARKPDGDASEKDESRKSGIVAIVDDDRLTVVRLNKDRIVSFDEEEHDSHQAAVRAAAKVTRRSGRIVWAGDVALRELAPAPEEIHPRMVALDQAERLARGFDAERLAVAIDRTALSPSGGDDPEWGSDLRKILSKRSVTVSGFAVGPDDGAWLRIGYQHAEMTLVHDGVVKGHRILGPGVRRARELLLGNPLHTPDTVLREMARELGSSIHAAIVGWQKTLPTVRLIWMHGPGSSTGRLGVHSQDVVPA